MKEFDAPFQVNQKQPHKKACEGCRRRVMSTTRGVAPSSNWKSIFFYFTARSIWCSKSRGDRYRHDLLLFVGYFVRILYRFFSKTAFLAREVALLLLLRCPIQRCECVDRNTQDI